MLKFRIQHNPAFTLFCLENRKSNKLYNRNCKIYLQIVENIQNKEINEKTLTIPDRT